jgi:hypothetical protein
MNKKEKPKKRPLSHNPLLNFPHQDNFLYSNPKFMNEELWKRKYNLRKLHEKWERKVKTNFLNIDLKFGPSKNKNNKLNKVIYRDNNIIIKPHNVPLFVPLSPTNKNKSAITMIENDKYDKYSEKYNDKISYYLSNKNPWNSDTRIDAKKNDSINNFKRCNITKNELLIRNNLKNSNESKSIMVKCNYYNNNYIQKIKKLKELINKYENDILQEISKKYEKEIKLQRHGKQDFKKYLIYKEMIKKYQKLYKNILPAKNNILKRCNSEINLIEIKNKNSENEKIFEELYIIINYLKGHKDILNNQKDKDIIIKSFFDVVEKDEYLRDKNLEYQLFITNFGNIVVINDNSTKDKNDSVPCPNLLSIRKKNGSCLSLRKNSNIKKKYLEYNISFYHPGTYYLFNKGEDEYHAWSCCMNDNKTSKGCCKKVEKIPIFNYDIIM